MKNVQIIDGASNATFSLFQATDAEFAAIFPEGRDMDLIEDLIERLGDEQASRVLAPVEPTDLEAGGVRVRTH